jgi:hypothetical protein
MPGVAQETVRDLGQGVIQLARVREFFRAVDNQNVAHYFVLSDESLTIILRART